MIVIKLFFTFSVIVPIQIDLVTGFQKQQDLRKKADKVTFV